MRHIRLKATLATCLASVLTGLALAGAVPSPAAAAPAPLKIALVTSETGVASQEFSGDQVGFLARIALQNAHGGVNGHKLVPIVINDQSSLTTVVTGVQDAISQGVIGVVSVTPFMFAAYKYLYQAGLPVTGGFFDGPEWGTKPYTNMFASDAGSVDPKYPANTAFGLFMKAHGGTVLGSYGYGISPSSTRSAIGTAISVQHAGLKVGVLDTSIPFGSVNFTTQALVAKSKHVNAIYAGLDNNSNFALATALQQAGVKPKVVVFPTGYEPEVIHSSVWKTLQGDYFDSEFRPFSIPDAGTRQMAAALQKYEHRPPSQFPTYSIYESWMGADLMIKGLQLAGKNPTPAKVIKSLRGIKSYNGNGLLPEPIDYSTVFGHDLPKSCGWYLRAAKNGFVPTSSRPVCGTDIPGTTTISG
ncbi:MAG: ABC transporter substrate-binding protein [Acidimicrobiales bacterium]